MRRGWRGLGINLGGGGCWVDDGTVKKKGGEVRRRTPWVRDATGTE